MVSFFNLVEQMTFQQKNSGFSATIDKVLDNIHSQTIHKYFSFSLNFYTNREGGGATDPFFTCVKVYYGWSLSFESVKMFLTHVLRK